MISPLEPVQASSVLIPGTSESMLLTGIAGIVCNWSFPFTLRRRHFGRAELRVSLWGSFDVHTALQPLLLEGLF